MIESQDRPGEEESNYGKRPLWQWIVGYLLIAAIIYWLIYYFIFNQKIGY